MSDTKVMAGGEFLIRDIAPEDIFIPEDMTKEHKMIFKAATDFVKKEIQPLVEQIEAKDEAIARRFLAMAGDLGLNGTDVPVAYGGEEMDKVTTCLVAEVMGGAPSLSVAHAAHTGIGTLPIVYFGTEEQKKRYLPKLANGEWFAAYCLTEPSAGSDALNALTTATLSEDGKHYILNGEKIYITNGAWADVFIVYAKVDGEHFTGFIVEREFPGVSHGAEEKKMGIKGSSTTSVILKDCQVPVENVLFEIGQGHKIAFNVLNIGRYKLGCGVAGGSKIALAESARYATTREQFGKKIASFGMIKGKLADMAIQIYITESMVYRLAQAFDDKFETLHDRQQDGADAKTLGAENARAIEEYAIECSIVKVMGSEALDFCVDETVQIHGGAGYTAEYMAERMYRDARINRIFEGTNEINRLLIPGTLVKRAMQNRLPLLDAVQAVGAEIKAYDPKTLPADDDPLARPSHMVGMAKKILLMTAGTAVNKLLATLNDEQEVLARLADIISHIFAMESGVLRAQKFAAKKGLSKAQYHVAAARVYVSDTMSKVVHDAEQILAYVEAGDALAKQVGAVHKLAACQPIDTVKPRRLIADKVIKGKKYIF